MKKSGISERPTFHQRKRNRIEEKRQPQRIPLYVLEGCDIAQMAVWAQLNRVGTQVVSTSVCEFATSGDIQPVGVSRVSKRNEPTVLSCSCANKKCDHHS